MLVSTDPPPGTARRTREFSLGVGIFGANPPAIVTPLPSARDARLRRQRAGIAEHLAGAALRELAARRAALLGVMGSPAGFLLARILRAEHLGRAAVGELDVLLRL